MTELSAMGITVDLPTGWEGRIFRRPESGGVATAADGAPAPAGETTHSVAHFCTISLPQGVGDFASGAVEQLGAGDALIVLFEYGAASVDAPLFARKGAPQALDADAFSPSVLQRTIAGQAGVQLFFTQGGRAFCLYVVLGSYRRRRETVPLVNDVLASLKLAPA